MGSRFSLSNVDRVTQVHGSEDKCRVQMTLQNVEMVAQSSGE